MNYDRQVPDYKDKKNERNTQVEIDMAKLKWHI